MADAPVTPQIVTRIKLEPTYAGSLSVSDVYTFPNDGRLMLHIKNTDASLCTVTVEVTPVTDGLILPDRTFTVPATTGDVMAGPFPPSIYNNAGKLRVSYSNITALTHAGIRLP